MIAQCPCDCSTKPITGGKFMANHKNLSTPFIYLRSTGENISVTKEQRDAFYKEADRIRHKEQHYHRCMCNKKHLWECDGDCIGCKYHAAGDTLSLDIPTLVDAWRQSNPHIVQFWWAVDHAVTEAVKYKHTTTGYVLTFYCRRGMLFITLPSGRNLVYVKPKAMHRSLRIRISMHFSRVYVSFMMTLC